MTTRTTVLIVGGGPSGLTAALFLERYGVPFILIEKEEHDLILPRARGWAVRTVEIYRQLGLEEALQTAARSAWLQGEFGGARRGKTMLMSESLNFPAVRQVTGMDSSPSSFCACPQTLIEPVLRRPLQMRGADLRYGHRLNALFENSESITAHVHDACGNELEIIADYAIGADGGNSSVRSALGIQSSRDATGRNYVNLFFRADLADAIRGRTFSQCEIVNDRVRGLFLSNNNTTEWSFHLEYDPVTTNAGDLSDTELIQLIRAAIGDEHIPIQLLGKSIWSTAVRVAESYQVGRVFLAGDAAHTMPPWGGFNANTGIADAHNLAWKIAAVVKDKADVSLLRSYQEERWPVATRVGKQALLRTDFDARFEIETEANRDAVQQMKTGGALLMRYQYGISENTHFTLPWVSHPSVPGPHLSQHDSRMLFQEKRPLQMSGLQCYVTTQRQCRFSRSVRCLPCGLYGSSRCLVMERFYGIAAEQPFVCRTSN